MKIEKKLQADKKKGYTLGLLPSVYRNDQAYSVDFLEVLLFYY
jgi:hypothetical protein